MVLGSLVFSLIPLDKLIGVGISLVFPLIPLDKVVVSSVLLDRLVVSLMILEKGVISVSLLGRTEFSLFLMNIMRVPFFACGKTDGNSDCHGESESISSVPLEGGRTSGSPGDSRGSTTDVKVPYSEMSLRCFWQKSFSPLPLRWM